MLGFALAFLATLVGASQLPAKTIFQFSHDLDPSWLECVLPRDNGDLLLTTVSPSASIYTLSRPWDANPKITSKITLPSPLNGALGLADLGDNKYAVATGHFHDHFYLREGTIQIWLLDYTNSRKPTQRHVVSMPTAGELNDMVVLSGTGDAADILVADSQEGRIWKVSMDTGDHSIWLDSEAMKWPIKNSTERWPFGINGMRFGTDGYLYFSNTNTRMIWRIKMNADKSAGEVEYVYEICGAAALDNFAIDKQNRLWVTSNKDNKLILVEQHGDTWKSKVVLGGETNRVIAGDTAVAFGKTTKDALMLYVVTSGANAAPVPPENFKEPAKLVRVDVSEYFS